MLKKSRPRCIVPRILKNPKAFYRWFKGYRKRVQMTEQELGEELYTCG